MDIIVSYMKHLFPPPSALKLAILYSGLKQIDVAKRAGIHESRLSKIVRGHDDATESEKRRLARVLRTSIADLFPDDSSGQRKAVPA